MDPLWNSLVVGGLQPDKEGQLKPFLGFIGMIGTHYEDAHIATGAATPGGTYMPSDLAMPCNTSNTPA